MKPIFKIEADDKDITDLLSARLISLNISDETGLVSDGRMSAVSKGETDPISDNVSSEGREKNRRIEIEITY